MPLSEMFQYVSNLRGMTKGRAQYSMQLEKYEVVPPQVRPLKTYPPCFALLHMLLCCWRLGTQCTSPPLSLQLWPRPVSCQG